MNISPNFSKIEQKSENRRQYFDHCKERKNCMSKNVDQNADNSYESEEMTVDLDLEDGTSVTCAVITILTVSERDYIVLLPLDESGENTEGEVWFYRYSENPNDPNEEPELTYIEDDEEYEAVADAFDEYLDSAEFDELIDDDK